MGRIKSQTIINGSKIKMDMKKIKSILMACSFILALAFTSCNDDDGGMELDNSTYATVDQMGRPAINTVFNFFGTSDVKNAYNLTLPSNGSNNSTAFAGILDALQTYIGLDPNEFENILGIGNDALAGVLAVDVLQSNKNAASSYGTLNGRTLSDDVIDVTLTLAFGDQSTVGSTNAVKDGLVSDNVDANDKSFSNTFPYLASPH